MIDIDQFTLTTDNIGIGIGIFDVDIDIDVDIDFDIDVDIDLDHDIDVYIDKGFANCLPIDIESKRLQQQPAHVCFTNAGLLHVCQYIRSI